MSTVFFRFFGRLRDFLRPNLAGQAIPVHFRGRQTVKHLAESLGVPHTEMGEVRVNGQAGSLTDIPEDRSQVEIRPIPDGFTQEPRFLLDCHLGRLAGHLRMLGFDCLYQNDYDDDELAEVAERENRILLSRDRRLFMRKTVRNGYCLRSLEPWEQLCEVIQRFGLGEHFTPFHRCIRCNQSLEPVSKEEVLDRLEPLTKEYFEDFHICPACRQIYWKGSHYERMRRLIKGLGSDQGVG